MDERDRLIVLDRRDLGGDGVVFSYTKAGKARWGQHERVPYSYWFDIVQPLDPDDVLATYTLSLSKRGNEKLRAIGVPVSFPAVVRYETRTYQSYYFCGDYADQGSVPSIYQTVGFDRWRKWTASSRPDDEPAFYWKVYVPMMKAILQEIKTYKEEKKQPAAAETAEQDGIRLAGTVGRDDLQVYRRGRWEPLLIKGVNLGISKPGAFPGEANITKEEYFRWLQYIGAMGANAIRVYTIHPPAFYEALYEYNQTAKQPLYLFHGVWIDEAMMLRIKDVWSPAVDGAFRAEIRRTTWALLNVTDPSRREVMGDIWSKEGLKSREIIPGIRLGVYVANGERSFSFPAMEGNVLPVQRFYTYTWPTWETPRYHERLKPSYEAMKAAFSGADIAKQQGNE
ncbi:hypothetical protein UM396_10385 [Geobacillus subterraneus]|uniref:hypothetical protein n=1 Tax=Geobacillus subterraneus TaxID=129338 RepID=UPI002AC971D8|nr:hypothetical protein [Geobacillus subterraneus]WPZ17028.1 hypothetical protein UM396_10385 [Geobacillus subterraneus]